MEKVIITVNDNGSLKIEGDVSIVDKNGKEYGLKGRNKISLCRCGFSENKPFCDGKHKNQFNSVCEAFDLPEPVSK